MAAGAFPRPLISGPAIPWRAPHATPVPRRRIAHLLDLTGDSTLTSVVAPRGSGKRTLVRGWLEHHSSSWAWAMLAPDDDDPRALTRRLHDATEFAAVRSIGSVVGDATVVIEHSHVIQRPDTVDAFIAWLAETSHDHRVIAIGEVSLPSALRTAHGRSVVELRAADLDFTRSEIDELVAGRGLPASPGFVDALLDITRGWAAPVDIAIRCLAADSPRGISQAISELRDFAMKSVMPSLPSELQRFLCEVAAADHADLHIGPTGGRQRPALVQEALDRQLLVARDGAETRLGLHPYLIWALRTRATFAAPSSVQTTPTAIPARRFAPPRETTPVRRTSIVARRPYQLTRREADVLALLGSELTMREIAATLCVSRDTVKSHSRSIYRKLSVTSREDAVTAASAARLLE
jgi:ATP/maltotriose-dependent transcriptional regulator MalT